MRNPDHHPWSYRQRCVLMHSSQTLIRESASGASGRENSGDLGESREGGPMKDHSRHESVGDSGVGRARRPVSTRRLFLTVCVNV